MMKSKRLLAMLLAATMLVGVSAAAFAEEPAEASAEAVVVTEAPAEPAPAPVEQPAPAPVEQPAPAPVEQPAPAPVEEPAPAPVEQPAPAPVEQPAPAVSETPAETETPSESETPVETETPSESETPVETEIPSESETPVETETPVVTETPAEIETPAETEIPAETETPVETEIPVEPEVVTVNVTVGVAWNDNGNEQGLRPSGMDITLYGSDGGVYTAQLTRNSEIAWTHTFTGMPDCSYSLEAVCPDNYNMKIDQETLTVYNTLRVSAKPEETTEPEEGTETEETTEPVEGTETEETTEPVEGDETEETTEPVEGDETEEITEPEAEPQAPNIRATIQSSRRPVMTPGETVVLTAKVEGAEGYETMLQWQCDKGNGFEDVPGANGETLSFEASVETLAYSWRVAVYYR